MYPITFVTIQVDLTWSKIAIGFKTNKSTVTNTFCHAVGITAISFEDEISSIQREVTNLTSYKVDMVLCLGHAGFVMDQVVAEMVEGCDVVIGGHTHTFLYTGLTKHHVTSLTRAYLDLVNEIAKSNTVKPI